MGSLFLPIVLVLLVIVAVAVIAVLRGRLPAASADEPVFDARKELFTPAERSFIGVLEQAVAGEFKIFGKVRVGDLVQPAKGLSQSRRTSLRNRIQQKHVDFVLCRPDTLEVAGVVELDDASHGRKDRADRDDFVDKALASAGVPVLHFPVRKGYAVVEIQERLAATLGVRGAESAAQKSVEPVNAGQDQAVPASTSVVVEAGTASAAPVAPRKEIVPPAGQEPAAETLAAPNCPACSVPMVKRQAKKGPNAGKWFWACTGYPNCRKILAVGS
jgi:hypothetical protein